jgi:hypothetical protein
MMITGEYVFSTEYMFIQHTWMLRQGQESNHTLQIFLLGVQMALSRKSQLLTISEAINIGKPGEYFYN